MGKTWYLVHYRYICDTYRTYVPVYSTSIRVFAYFLEAAGWYVWYDINHGMISIIRSY